MTTVAHVFQDAVRTASSHRKNIVVLRKLHLKQGTLIESDFWQCLLHIMPVKKGNAEAERAVKFLAAYLEAMDQDVNGKGVPANATELKSSLVHKLLFQTLRGARAKDKVVRYRVCQIVAVLLNQVDELESDEAYFMIRDHLMERTRDKEATVRVQAATALSRLQEGTEDDEEDPIRDCLLNMLQHDPNADVRKAVLWNIEVNSISLPYMLQRARDVDAQVRKLAFMKVGEDVKKMTLLTVPERDALMNSGLSDRDSNVQKSCVKLMCEKWLPQCDGDMMTFLRKMDVIDGKAAESAVRAFLLANPSLDIPYNAETWNNLDVEEAAFLRSAIVHFAEDGMEDELEAALPPLIEHSDILKRYSLLMAQTEDQAEKIAFGFILKQLLLTAEQQDFTDEMGRREMLISLRDILSSVDLSKENILIAVGILKKLSLNEGDFTRVIIEILYTIYDPETMESGEMDEELDEIEKSMLLLKCLDLTACVLECTEENLRENSAMNGILTTFILPALKNEHGAIQYAGLQNLGLMCLLDKDLAKSHLPIFTSAFVDNRQAISLLALKEFFDLTILFGPSLLADSGALSEVISETLQCDDEELLALAVEGAAKLMILGYLSDPTILQQIIILYFHPLTKDMNRLRQCLSYFLPVYSHASCKHQKLLRTVIVPCLQILIQEHVVSKDAMIQPLQIGQQLVDWTDVRKVVGFERGSADVDEGLHADLAIDLLEASILDEDLATQKLFCQLLNRLYFGSFAGLERIARVAELINTLKEAVPSNSPILPNLRKFAKTISDMNEASFTQETETEFLALQTLTTALSELRIELGGPAAAAAVDMGSTDTVGGLVRGSGEPEPEADAQDGEEDDEEEEDSS